jgi:hypothetical protein
LKGGSWANTGGPGASSTHHGLLPQPTTELDDDLGTTGHSNYQGKQMDKQEEEGFYSPEGFPSLHETRWEICMGYARHSVRINQI